MLVLISYDVSTVDKEGRGRLRRVARLCMNKGQRVQNSVFECALDNAQLVALRADLLSVIDLKKDSIRIYSLGNKWHQKVEHYGTKPSYDPEGPLVV